MSTRLLHTADTHLGYTQYHKSEREQDFIEAFRVIVTEAIDRDVDGVVHAGDLFHQSRPTIATLSAVVAELQRLAVADIPFFIIVGNHDGTRERQWPEFLSDIGLAEYLNYDGTVVGDVTLYGQDHVGEPHRPQLDYQFAPCETKFSALVAHGLFRPVSAGDWDLDRIITKSTVDFDAFLLGDDHVPTVEWIDDSLVTYPGSTERTAADQRSDRRFNIVTFNGDGVHLSWHEIETRHFEYIDIEMQSGDDEEDIVADIEQREIPDGCVVIVTLTGDGEQVTSGIIEQAGLRKGALVVQVNDQRDIAVEELDYEEVTFADPDDAVKERKSSLDISPVADDFEQLARDLGDVPTSNLASHTEEAISDLLGSRDVDDFKSASEVSKTAQSTNSDNGSEDSEEEEPTEAPSQQTQLSFDELQQGD